MRYAKTFGLIYAAVAAAIFAFASPARADAAETIKITYIVQADDHSAGDEHEIEYDIAGSADEPQEPDSLTVKDAPERQNGSRTRQQTPRN